MVIMGIPRWDSSSLTLAQSFLHLEITALLDWSALYSPDLSWQVVCGLWLIIFCLLMPSNQRNLKWITSDFEFTWKTMIEGGSASIHANKLRVLETTGYSIPRPRLKGYFKWEQALAWTKKCGSFRVNIFLNGKSRLHLQMKSVQYPLQPTGYCIKANFSKWQFLVTFKTSHYVNFIPLKASNIASNVNVPVLSDIPFKLFLFLFHKNSPLPLVIL